MVQGRIVFGHERANKLTGAIHRAQDCFSPKDVPYDNDLSEPAFSEVLSLAQIRRSDIDVVDTTPRRPTLENSKMSVVRSC
jgi:hypothetical protein